ncbi:MAG: hypothetical protein J6K92_13500 [Oscillospiraceae bacterium]|nr:hypothetical protein [Oscillospiraceae bacterium]
MKKDEFIANVLEQVRCKKTHDILRAELSAHIDDQAEAFEAVGLPHEQCEEEAVKTMGDAVDIGLKLDSAHRPHFPFIAVLCAAALMLCGILIRVLLAEKFPLLSVGSHDILAVFAGIVCFTIFCCIDYTIFARLSKKAYPLVAVLFTVMLIILRLDYIAYSNGRTDFFYLGRLNYALIGFYGCIMLVPFMCGFVYRMRGKAMVGFLICCAVLTVPALILCCFTHNFAVLYINTLNAWIIIMFALKKGWFSISKRLGYLIVSIPAALLILSSAAYESIRSLKNHGNAIAKLSFIWDFLMDNGTTIEDGWFIDDSMLLLGVIKYYGILSGVVLGIIMLMFPFLLKLFSHRVHSSFGQLLASSVIFVFTIQAVCYIASNMGINMFYASYSSAPFISIGVYSYAAWGMLLGIFASIYLRSDLFPERKLDRITKAY